MAGAEAELDNTGTALWLTDWHTDEYPDWTPRRVLALVGGVQAGQLDFLVHPDGQALAVWMLDVEPGFESRNLASVMMDALHAAHPTAWIDHGSRTLDGAFWWDRYTDPAPERNIHNRPPEEWARYFDALVVMGQRARNAHQNRRYGLDGHSAAEYRHGERLEAEAAHWAPAYRQAQAQGPDPAAAELYGGLRLVLPNALQRAVYDEGRDAGQRAEQLLDHIGHGSLPYAAWHTTPRAAFEHMAQQQILAHGPAEDATHVAFRVRLTSGREAPRHTPRATWVSYTDSPGIEVELSAMSWRSPQTPWATHTAEFDQPIDAAIAPKIWADASAQYKARFDEIGELRPGQSPRRATAADPLAGREADIAALAARLKEASRRRAAAALPASAQEESESLRAPQQNPSPHSPRLT
ncbi:hypothetical protein OG728_39320 (plasmid) [Streptomyces microflavus]|uniref:hypothetical protein n=1 Tax=Streptomyces microflavus TaxID=1919 RepID=UPI002E146AB2|nr:hypothetical protein OG728_39320 [Streptomyces microflavus]